jgi:hypothetical protein
MEEKCGRLSSRGSSGSAIFFLAVAVEEGSTQYCAMMTELSTVRVKVHLSKD